jgi:hypothetical protein
MPTRRPTSPTAEHVDPECETRTPVKVRVQSAYDFCQKRGIKGQTEAIFRENGVTHATGWRLVHASNSRRLHDDPTKEETRGRKSVVTPKHIREMEKILEEEGIEARALTWAQLGYEVGLECHGDTVKRAMGTMDYHKCIACQRGWVNQKTAQKRVDWSTFMLERYPEPEDWYRVRFSDECHFGWGDQQKLRIIRKPGQRYCYDCIQERDEPSAKDRKRFHCWCAVGHDFKSKLTLYNVAGNTNGKMSQRVYIDQILEPVVKPWILAGHNFALEEDGDSGHGPGKGNIVRTWKEKNHLEYYFNCPSSPDLSPIENCWLPPKQHLQKFPHWEDAMTKELIFEGWEKFSQHYINERVDTMPARLQAVIDGEGKMTGY